MILIVFNKSESNLQILENVKKIACYDSRFIEDTSITFH